MRKNILGLLMVGVLFVATSVSAWAQPITARFQAGPMQSTIGVEVEVPVRNQVSLVAVGHGTYVTAGGRGYFLGNTGPFATGYVGYNWDKSSLWTGATGGYEFVVDNKVSIKAEVGGAYKFDEEKLDVIFAFGVGYRF